MAEEEHVALVIGVTGINGSSISSKLLERGWKVHGTGLRSKPVWLPAKVNYIQVDLLNRENSHEKLSALNDVTHIFWAAWIPRNTEEENCEANGSMLKNALDPFSHPESRLAHICLTTGAKHYLGPFDRFGTLKIPDPPFTEDLPRLEAPNFYYVQEDILKEVVNKKPSLSYSIHRPGTVFGFAPRNYMNCLAALAVYATICKREKLAFEFFGTPFAWEQLCDASDADLIAEQEIWAATDAGAKNQAFNVSNGDVFKWKKLWGVIAECVGVECAAYGGKAFSLAERMKGMDGVWDSIVEEHKLVASKLEDVGQFWFVDAIFHLGAKFEVVLSMNKSKEHGFLGFRNSEKSVRYWIQKLQDENIIPKS